jgi:hypothetical protein
MYYVGIACASLVCLIIAVWLIMSYATSRMARLENERKSDGMGK